MAVLYQCSVGIRCVPYFSTVLDLHDSGVTVYHADEWLEYEWEDLYVQNYAFATTYLIKSKDHKDPGYFSHGLPNVERLIKMIGAETETN